MFLVLGCGTSTACSARLRTASLDALAIRQMPSFGVMHHSMSAEGRISSSEQRACFDEKARARVIEVVSAELRMPAPEVFVMVIGGSGSCAGLALGDKRDKVAACVDDSQADPKTV